MLEAMSRFYILQGCLESLEDALVQAAARNGLNPELSKATDLLYAIEDEAVQLENEMEKAGKLLSSWKMVIENLQRK